MTTMTNSLSARRPARPPALHTARHPARLFLPLALLAAGAGALANDFPTVERVLYVQECVRANPGPHYEMVNKCSCALDALAAELKFDDYSTMITIANGMSIGGERGGAIRDTPSLAPDLKRYRELQVKVKRGCFINDAK
jgi:hypothetical protein